MAISEGKGAAVAVNTGGNVLPDIGENGDSKIAVVNRDGAFMDKHHGGNGRGTEDIRILLVGRDLVVLHEVSLGPAAHLAVHRPTADPGIRLGTHFERCIVRAAVNVQRSVILPEAPLHDVIPVGGTGDTDHVPADPSFGAAKPVQGETIIVVILVKHPSQLHLLQVAEATRFSCLRLGLGQSRQKHAGQNGNNGNDDEEFDQRKSSGGRLTLTRRKVDVHKVKGSWTGFFLRLCIGSQCNGKCAFQRTGIPSSPQGRSCRARQGRFCRVGEVR